MAYPNSVATDADLYLVKNQLATQLNGSIDAVVTTITVDSTTGFPTVGTVTIDSEVIKYTGLNATQFTGCTRGFDGTGAASHTDNAPVRHAVTAIHHNALKDELIAVETDLINNLRTNMPNILINGGMEVWQRNTSFSNITENSYAADRWKMRMAGGTPTSTTSRDNVVFDTTGLYSFKTQITAVNGATHYFVQQVVENFADFIGKTITLNVRVKCSSAGLIQVNVADGVTNTLSALNTGTGWETLTVTKTLSASMTFLAISIGFVSNFGGSTSPSISTFNVDNVMMALGSTSIPFRSTDYQIELAQCQRYYSFGTFEMSATGGSDGTVYQLKGTGTLPVTMRGTPTVTGSNWVVQEDGSATNQQASYTKTTPIFTGNSQFRVQVTKAVGGSRPATMNMTWVAEAEL